MNKRSVILGVSLLTLAAFISLLGWAISHSKGIPGSLGINKVFGEVTIQERPAPNFTLHLIEGGSVTLENLKGNLVVLDFWSSWCPPCRKEAPNLAKVYSEYRDKGVEFIGISIWDRLGDAEDYVTEFQLTYPSGIDPNGSILIDYGVVGIPEKFFIDAEGQIVAKYVGPSSVEDLRTTLDDILSGRH